MGLLELSALTVQYGGVRAVDAVSLDVPEGAFVGLIGPNGAGKTTFIDAVTGLVPASGSVRFDDREIARLPAHRRARAGLARTFQSIELFDDLTVRENLLVAAERASWLSMLRAMVRPAPSPDAEERVERALDCLGITDLAEHTPDEISLGRRKLVTVARALAADPRMVLLDEPAAGLDSTESAELGRRLRQLTGDGRTVLLVDHDMGLVSSVCDHVYVLDFGRIIAEGTAATVLRDPRVVTAYLGSETGPSVERVP
ncbi:ABC transporter ATP-binding protein [Pseudonocardia alni]|uniref:ABC transporter ATP-binding protein n=1 Tax=Pseudonocardia alni TaxID=33907 RepID=UPI001AD6B157|nr:ABC transporter ATP-binding protein [Pseudonocardia alni]